jgi:2-methylisocitrate lyase-like PEP mutase family enzyme
VLFVEAVRTREEIERVVREVEAPLLYNFVEHGKSPLLPVAELQRLGFKMVIFPGSIMLAVLPLVHEILGAIKQHGTTEALLDRMTDVVELFETMGLSEMLAFDARLAGGTAVPSVTDAQS